MAGARAGLGRSPVRPAPDSEILVIFHTAHRGSRTVAHVEPVVEYHIGRGRTVGAPQGHLRGRGLSHHRNQAVEAHVARVGAVVIAALVENLYPIAFTLSSTSAVCVAP